MKVGVMNSVIGGGDDAESFRRAREIGCDGVEVILLREHLRRGDRIESLRAAMDETGLALPSFVLDEHNLGGISSADADVAAAAADDVRVAIAWAAELGARVILIPFFVDAEIRDDEAFERTMTAFRELCPLAAARGVVLAYEGTLPAARVQALADRIGSPAFGCYFDLANPIVRSLDPPTEIRGLGDLIRRVHVKDLLARKNDSHLGLGRVDFAECAAALAEIGYDGWLVLETPAAPVPLVARDVTFTRATFGLDRTGGPVYGAFSDDHASWEDLADTFLGLGLGAVQLGGSLLDRCLEDAAFAAEGRAALAGHGLQMPALAAYRNLVAADLSAREEHLEHLRNCLELAPALGTWVVATGTGTRSVEHDWADHPDNWGKEAWRLLEDAIDSLLPAAEASGAVLALEGTWMTVLRTFSQVLDVLERHPSPNLQLVCDPYNYLTYEQLPAQDRLLDEFLSRFESRFVLAHLKDVGVDGHKTTRPEFGKGVFRHAPYLEFLRTRRPDLPLVLEHLPLKHVPDAIARANAYFA
jgi:sugar phosphate isomerase/epimerase